MIKYISVLLVLFLSACSTLPTVIDGTVSGKCPSPPKYSRPYLEINNIESDYDNSDKVKALNITIKQLMDYSEQLETYLDVYY